MCVESADRCACVSISDADQSAELPYLATVHHGIDLDELTLRDAPGRDLVFLGRTHPETGTAEAIEIARRAGRELVIAGILVEERFRQMVEGGLQVHERLLSREPKREGRGG